MIVDGVERDLDQEIVDYRTEFDHYITHEIVANVREYLGEAGATFFNRCLKEHGTVSPVIMAGRFPHVVHLMEGMEVRNHLRASGLIDEWTEPHALDNLWEVVVERAIK